MLTSEYPPGETSRPGVRLDDLHKIYCLCDGYMRILDIDERPLLFQLILVGFRDNCKICGLGGPRRRTHLRSTRSSSIAQNSQTIALRAGTLVVYFPSSHWVGINNACF
ncbi:MAG: hypothetical protein CMJ81_07750 [Planctomycetaceae bacterium]|nr:hypothetical protein [Planctomycetaceae bacterium]MBP61055.1 hypothetical protein [Planctomycetaceae bacterium]